MTYEQATARCWAEIDLDAFLKNYATARSLLSPGADLIPVLKANAYGIGAVRAARELYARGSRLFAVACLYEAREIRRALPGADVLILGYVSEEDCACAVREGMILTAHSRQSAARIVRAAQDAGMTARAQIKVETGLHRLGFDPGEADDMIAFAKNACVRAEGVYTHLALRDRESDEAQFLRFEAVRSALMAAGVSSLPAHACDSIGMVRYPGKHMDAVRVGAFLYGVCPYRYAHPETCLPVLALKTRVAQVRRLPAGECVGYDDEHVLARDSLVATLSAGYVDGYPRLNHNGEVAIRGMRARVLGLVCMDQMMVDVTEIPGVCEGDIATLLGEGIRVDEYATWAAMNRNEALSRVGRRVPRVYIKHGREDGIVFEM